MAGRVLATPLTAAAFGLLLVGLGAYVALRLLPLARSRHRIGLAAFGGAAVALYGAVVVAGVAIGSDRPLRPLDWAGLLTLATSDDDALRQFQVVTSDSALGDAIAAAKAKDRPVMIDFSAEWCTECRIMERTVFARDSIKRELDKLAVVRADVTRASRSSEAMMRRFAIVGPPTIVFLDAEGTERENARIVGIVDDATFLARLDLVGRR